MRYLILIIFLLFLSGCVSERECEADYRDCDRYCREVYGEFLKIELECLSGCIRESIVKDRLYSEIYGGTDTRTLLK